LLQLLKKLQMTKHPSPSGKAPIVAIADELRLRYFADGGCRPVLRKAWMLLLGLASGPVLAALGTSVTLVTGQPTDIYPGQTTELQITLSNSNDTAPVTNVAFSNTLPGTLPNGLKVAGAATYTCTDPAGPSTAPGSGVFSAVLGGQGISLSGGGIPARANGTDGVCVITIPVTAGSNSGSAATYNYVIGNGSVTGNDGVALQNGGTVNQSVNVRAVTPPSISKSFSSGSAVIGGSAVTLTIAVSNSSPVDIPNFSISDVFPTLAGNPAIKVASPPSATSTCTGGGTPAVFTPVAGAGSVSASGGTVKAGGSCTMTVAVTGVFSNGQYSTGALTNTIDRSTQFGNDLGLVPLTNASANITVTSPLRVTKGFNHAYLSSGNSDSFTITLSNVGDTPLTVSAFADSPIDGIGNAAYGLKVSGTPTVSCSAGGAPGTYAATGGGTGINQTANTTIAAGGTCTITVPYTGTVQTAGTPVSYTNTIPANTVTVTTPNVVSQAASASVLVADDMRVTKSASPTTVSPGNPVRYTVTIENYGTAPVANVTVTDHLPASLTYLTGVINGKDYTPLVSAGCGTLSVGGTTGASAPVFTVPNLPGRTDINTPGSCTITFWAMSDTGAANGVALANVINVGDVCYNGGSTCNGGTATTPSNPSVSTAVLSTYKVFYAPGSAMPGSAPANPQLSKPEGSVVRMAIVLTNQSANALTNVTISDTLPTDVGGGQLRVATPSNVASTCGSPTFTASSGSTSVAMNGATVPARASNGTGANGTCYLMVDVIGPAGAYNNIATLGGTQTYANGTTGSLSPVSTNTAQLIYTSSLSAAKTFNPASVSSGGRSTVTVRLSNSGAVALGGVSVTDPLPAGMVLANPPNAYSTCAGSPAITAAAGGNSAAMTGAALAGNGTCDFLFDVIATGTANWVNTIPGGNITADGGVRNVLPISGTLVYAPPVTLSVAKSTNPSTLTFPGQASQLTITVSNGTQAVTNLRLTDYFTVDGSAAGALNGWRVAATPNVSTTCPGGSVSAAAAGTSVGLSGVSMAASTSCTLTVSVTSTSVGGVTNYIPANAIVTDQGLSNAGQATTSLTTQSNIGVNKQFIPNVVKPGQRSRLRITFYNPTSLPLADLTAIDTLPAGVTVPSGPNATTTCVGASVSAPAANQVQVSGANLGAASGGVSASCQVEIDVLVAAQGDYVNTIPAGGVTATSGGSQATNSQPTSDTLRAKAALVVNKAIDAKTLDTGNPGGFTTATASRAPGASAVLTVRLFNPNAAPLTGAGFTDSLPDGLVIAQTPAAATTCAGGAVLAAASGTSLRLSGATIPANGACTVSVNVLSNVPGIYTNTIPSGAVSTAEGVVSEEATSARLLVSTPPTVSKQFSPAVIPPNGKSTLTIFIGNDNASAITLSAPLVDTLPTAPDNVVVASPANVSKTCPGAVTATAGGASVTYASGALVPVGGCSISVDVTTGSTAGTYNNNIPAGALQTNVGNNQQPANAALSLNTLGYIGGKVFKDNSVVPNGTFQSGTDTPIAGTTVELHSGNSCAGPLLATATTDVLGNYLFASLAAGTYSVCQPVQPTGTTNGITTAGTMIGVNGSTGTAGSATNPTSTTSQITAIVLNGNGAGGEISGSVNNNFAEVVSSSIAGTVFLDQGNDGLINGTDSGIAGVSVELLDAGGAVLATTLTAADGSYRFDNLQPGTYSVREPSQPASTSNGITTAGAVPNGGTAGTATTTAVLPSRIGNIVLPPNTVAGGNNFAEISNGRTLSGSIFLDFNNNGLIDGNDHGIGGQQVVLSGTDVNGNAVSRTATTAADGSYSFTGLPEGTYAVAQPSQPSGTTNGTPSAGSTGGTASNPTSTTSQITGISLTGNNTVSANNNFAEQPGAAPDLAIAKTHAPASFGDGSGSGYFTITPRNIGTVATSGTITVTDTLPAGLTVGAVATGTGWSCLGSIGASVVTCTSNVSIPPNATGNPIILHVVVASGTAGQILVNTATIAGGGEPQGFEGNNTATDPVSVATTARLSGNIWLDLNHDRRNDAGDPKMQGWQAELLLNGVVVATATTNALGQYTINNLAPGSGYEVRFRDPATGTLYGGSVTNEQGIVPTPGVRDSTQPNSGTNSGNPAGATVSNGLLTGMTLLAGDNIVEQSLPLDPSGIVYDAVTRQPVPGATVTISGPVGFNPAADLVSGSASQVVGANGFYQFLLTSTAPAGTYTLTVSAPGYLPAPSTLIPPCVGPLAVGAGPNPALIQASDTAPSASVPNAASPSACVGVTVGGAPTTQYYFGFTLGAGSANVLNNHLPLEPVLSGAIVMTKTTPLVNVHRGDLVPYTVTATNRLSAPLQNINVTDRIPPGFRYRLGSASLNGLSAEPVVVGRDLTWKNLSFSAGEKKTFKIILVVGTGVGEGEYTNQAWSLNSQVNSVVSNVAGATVRIVPDPTFDCSDLIGKVFDDKNANGYQDEGEPGIPNVRVVTARGLLITSDADGRFHVTCADIPQIDHGSNFVIKLDERTLPSGYRLTTENPRDVRLTRGKMSKLNFGATVHRVVRLELTPAAFAEGDRLGEPWLDKLPAVLNQLKGRPSILRLSYAGDKAAGKARLHAIAEKFRELWKARPEDDEGLRYPLIIETELEGAK
jgi:uncharacterized repeat protein (TIGR01451 family)